MFYKKNCTLFYIQNKKNLLISYFFKGQNLISSKIVVELKDLKVVLEVDTTEGIIPIAIINAVG